MKKSLIDSGPLIALFNKNDKYFNLVSDFLKKYNGILFTTWPVVTEVSHLLSFNINAQLDFIKWIKRGGLIIENIIDDDIDRIIYLSEKYSDLPMDLADASLVTLAERLGLNKIITIDKDFTIYRHKKGSFINLLKL